MISSEIRAEARKSLAGKWGKAAIQTLIFAIVSYLITLVLNFVPVLGSIANFLISPVLAFGLLVSFIKLKRNEEFGYFDFFQNGFSFFGKIWSTIGYTLLKLIVPIILLIVSIVILFVGMGGSMFSALSSVSASTTASLGFLGVIGFILYFVSLIWIIVKGFSYVLNFYLLYDNPDMNAKDIIEKSESLMNGHKWAYFWLGLTFIGWAFLACFTLGIGMLWLLPYMQIAKVVFYEDLAGSPVNVEIKEDNGPIA